MSAFKIHFLGSEVQTLPYANNMSDVMWHLGAKYGARLYNAGVKTGAIVFIPEDETVKVNPKLMQQLAETVRS